VAVAIIKKGREKSLINRHPWVFSGAIARKPKADHGAIVEVRTSTDELMGHAFYNSHTMIALRMINFHDENPMESITKNLREAIALRKIWFEGKKTNAYRIINAEGDLLPGLTVDRYADYLVLQITTAGMQKIKTHIVDLLLKDEEVKGVYEKTNGPSLSIEGVLPAAQHLYGEVPERAQVVENGLAFTVDIKNGQKTGFFLDQRESRELIRRYARDKRVLNVFSYTGAFSVYALAGGAESVDSVDVSAKALELASENVKMNGYQEHQTIQKDAFQFLREDQLDYDIIILDPPAFAKKQKDVVHACRGYKDINRLVMEKVPSGSLLLTCSCSHHINDQLFRQVLFQAASEAKRNVRILEKQRQGVDHPINLFHPEGDYLKSYLLLIT